MWLFLKEQRRPEHGVAHGRDGAEQRIDKPLLAVLAVVIDQTKVHAAKDMAQAACMLNCDGIARKVLSAQSAKRSE